MNWHQLSAAKRSYRLRNHAAHIDAENYIQTGRSLCGLTKYPVSVDPVNAHNPENKTCKKCLAKLRKSK